MTSNTIYHCDFIPNKYYNLYFRIINNRINNKLNRDVYKEKHHIIPKSLGGSNDKINIVSVTAREHFILHKLLPKFTIGQSFYKMNAAITFFNSNENRKLVFTSHDYEVLKLANSFIL